MPMTTQREIAGNPGVLSTACEETTAIPGALPKAFPTREENGIDVLVNGRETFPKLLEIISGAETSVFLETFIYWNGKISQRVAEALSERARAGLDVRVVLDWVGCLKLSRRIVRDMRASGVQVRYFRPLNWKHLRCFNKRSHRKLLLVDGFTSMTGGSGIADEWTGNGRKPGDWRDNHYVIQGPLSADLEKTFLSHWPSAEKTSENNTPPRIPQDSPGEVRARVISSNPDSPVNAIHGEFLAALRRSQERIAVITPYFAPSEALCKALIKASNRGVEVQILTCGPRIDQKLVRWASRHYWGQFLEAGIRIFEYQPSVMHSKVLIVDSSEVTIGSANFDSRSCFINGETNILIKNCRLTNQHWDLLEADLKFAKEVSLESWKNRGPLTKALDFLASLLRSQL